MQKWEYELGFAKFEDEWNIVNILNEKGRDGWELVAVTETEGGFNFYLKRSLD